MALNDVENMKAIISVSHNGEICVVSIGNGKRYIGNNERGYLERAFARNRKEYGKSNEAIKAFCEEVGWKYGK